MTLNIVAISGSPADPSSSASLAKHVLRQIPDAQTTYLGLTKPTTV